MAVSLVGKCDGLRVACDCPRLPQTFASVLTRSSTAVITCHGLRGAVLRAAASLAKVPSIGQRVHHVRDLAPACIRVRDEVLSTTWETLQRKRTVSRLALTYLPRQELCSMSSQPAGRCRLEKSRSSPVNR